MHIVYIVGLWGGTRLAARPRVTVPKAELGVCLYGKARITGATYDGGRGCRQHEGVHHDGLSVDPIARSSCGEDWQVVSVA